MVRHCTDLAAELTVLGCAVRAIAPAGTGGGAAGAKPLDIAGRVHPFRDLRAAALLPCLVRGTDVVHAHGLRAAWICALAGRRVGRPWVATAHNLPPATGALARRLMMWSLGRSSHVVAVSEAVADALAACGLQRDGIAVVPGGVRLSELETAARGAAPACAAGRPLVAAAGRLEREKGFDLLVAAAPEILRSFPEVQIVIAGEGSERAALESQIGSLGLESSISMPGRLDSAAPLLAAASVVAAPSRSEGQGLTIAEAMALRRAVVGTAVGGIREVIGSADNAAGVLVPPDDHHALSSAIVRLLSDDELRWRLGEGGRERVERLFTAASMAHGNLAVYRSCSFPHRSGAV